MVRFAGVAVSLTTSFPYEYENTGIPTTASAQYAVGTILLEQPVVASQFMPDGCTPMTVSSRIVVAATAEIPEPLQSYPSRRQLSTTAASTAVTNVWLRLLWNTNSGDCYSYFDTAMLTLIDDDGVLLLANETVYKDEGCAFGPVSLPEVQLAMSVLLTQILVHLHFRCADVAWIRPQR